jgi:hypothetical protein
MNRQNIKRLALTAVIVLGVILGTSITFAQRATELYIPIGKSPGLSGKYTTIGSIESLDVQKQTVVISDSSHTFTVLCSKDTRFYVDYSSSGKRNVRGTMNDCRIGMMAEVKYLGNKVGAAAEWIKVKGR